MLYSTVRHLAVLACVIAWGRVGLLLTLRETGAHLSGENPGKVCQPPLLSVFPLAESGDFGRNLRVGAYRGNVIGQMGTQPFICSPPQITRLTQSFWRRAVDEATSLASSSASISA